MKNLRTIILAAGKGTRMKSELPKVLHPVYGQPLIRYVVDAAKAVGSLKICVVLGYRYELVRDVLEKNIETVIQKRLLGTADAVRTTASFLRNFRGDVLILCGDTPLLRKETLQALYNKHRRTKAACTILTSVVAEPKGYGRIIRADGGKVVAIREDKDLSDLEKNIAEINTGVYCFKAEYLTQAIKSIKLNSKKKEFYLTDIVEILAKQEHVVEVQEADASEGLGINTREDLAVAAGIFRQRILSKFMLDGITITDPDTTYIEANVKIGHDTTIRPFTVIESNVRIGKNCVIGPFTHLRPGTRISNFVEVGNFAEVSRSKLGAHTLMKHFGFLGDAQVGSRVNIGAGTVTANYDGKNKSVTKIDDQAFIGSDSILIAPVKIGKKAVTAAGSVVTKNTRVPEGGMAVGVPARTIRKGTYFST